MNITEYLKQAIKNKYVLDIKWYYSVFSTVTKSNEFTTIEGDKRYFKTENGFVAIEGDKGVKVPLLSFRDVITLEPGDIENINTKVETTIGIALTNYVLIAYNFGKKIPFINGPISIGDLETNHILYRLKKNEEAGPNDIKVSEYINASKSVSFMRNWASFVVVSATAKTIQYPKGLDEYKAKVKKEITEKYGENALKNPVVLVEYENKLKEFDKKWLEDDPTFGVLSSGKVLNIARKKQYLTIGGEQGFKDTPEEATVIESSLHEGWPRDKESISALFNGLRAGSFDRGHETQESGVVAKALSSATLNFKTAEEDCDVKYGFEIEVTKFNAKELVGCTHIVNGKMIKIETKEQALSLIGKRIELRSPMYCKSPNDTVCKTCMGDVAGSYKNGILILAMDIGGIFLNAKMKSMHGKVLETIDITIDDLIT